MKRMLNILMSFFLVFPLGAQENVTAVLDAVLDSLEENAAVGYEAVDSAYLRGIEDMLEAEERERQARAAIDGTQRSMLKEEMSFQWDGMQPLLRGVVMAFTEDGFNDRPGMFKKYDRDMEDYGVAILPMATNWVLKLAGVESRSKTKRMLTANALAVMIEAGVVKTMKLAFDERRPDGDGMDAFPSGHSALAFVGATVLHREFGHHSPWISVGGYATATASQMLRLKHNRHWVHDTFVGAGVGIMSTNLAYFITDRIFGEGGVNQPQLTYGDMKRVLDYQTDPSGLTFMSGTEFGDRTVNSSVHLGAGFMVGVEGSWFLNNYFAVEAMAKYTTMKAKLDVLSQNGDDGLMARTVYGDNMDVYRWGVGARWSVPVGLTHRFGVRALVGTRTIGKAEFEDAVSTESVMCLPSETKPEIGVGFTYDCITTKKYAFGFNIDYHHAFSDFIPKRYGVSSVWKILL